MQQAKAPRIAIVEDDEVFTFLLREICQAAGHEVIWQTRNVTDALLMLGDDEPDTLLFDFALDGRRDGIELLTAVRKEFPQMQTILATGWDAERLASRIDYVAPDYLLQKPVMPADLIGLLKRSAEAVHEAGFACAA